MFDKAAVMGLAMSDQAKAAIGHNIFVHLNVGDPMAGESLAALIAERQSALVAVVKSPEDTGAISRLANINKAMADFLSLAWSAGPDGTAVNVETVLALPQMIGGDAFNQLARATAAAIDKFYKNQVGRP